jgi:hypothetical protein
MTQRFLEQAASAVCAGVRETALDLLALPAYADMATPAYEAALHDDDVVVRWRATDGLVLRGFDDRFLPAILDIAAHGADPDIERYRAVIALALWKRDSPEVRSVLRGR